MKCGLCKNDMTKTEVVRFLPNQNRLPYNSRVVETDLYTTGATTEQRHESCHILKRVSAPNYKGM